MYERKMTEEEIYYRRKEYEEKETECKKQHAEIADLRKELD